MQIPKELREQAVLEIFETLKQLGAKEKASQLEAEQNFNEVLTAAQKSHQRFAELVEQAKVQSLLEALRDGHHKDLVAILCKGNGMSKKTAKSIVDVIELREK